MTDIDAATLADERHDEEAERRIERCVRGVARVGPLFDPRADMRAHLDPDDERERRREREEDHR